MKIGLRNQRNDFLLLFILIKFIYPEYSLERLMLKLQYFGHLVQRADPLEKDPDADKQ